jgi:hypothetical protein
MAVYGNVEFDGIWIAVHKNDETMFRFMIAHGALTSQNAAKTINCARDSGFTSMERLISEYVVQNGEEYIVKEVAPKA